MIQFFWRQRFKEFGTEAYLSLQRSRFPVTLGVLDCHQANHGLGSARNDHLLAAASLLNQL
jgi:hypothetical protein